MTASLRALLVGVIDYAGLFPPAKLPLDAAVRRFASGRQAADGWMLSRFVAPAGRLGDLASYRDEFFVRGAVFPVTVVGRGGGSEEALLDALELDLADVSAFVKDCGDRVSVGALEFRLPPALSDPPAAPVLESLFDRVAALIRERCPAPLMVYYEAVRGPDWRRSIAALVASLRACRSRPDAGGRVPAAGLKLRCGGDEASLIPPVEELAFVVAACRDAGVPFKATAGLHHPTRRMDHTLLAKTHGFLNLFAAGALAHARGLDDLALAEALADEDPRAFLFDDRCLRWRDQSVAVEEIAQARATLAHSFGSCSFDDPRDGLAALGYGGDRNP